MSMVEIITKPELALVHYRDDEPCAVTFINGHEVRYKLDRPMNRKETEDFYEVSKIQTTV